MSIFRSAIADWSDVPTGSMKPTIIEGDRILINKMAYDIRIPFTHVSILKRDDPQRGDIIIFDSDISNKRLVKRVIGIPGDYITMRNNRVYLNGNALKYTSSHTQPGHKVEYLSEMRYTIQTQTSQSPYASFNPVTVPEGYYLVLGDNRDNSADSRAIGFIPRHEIVGKTQSLVWSLDYSNYLLPRRDRFLQKL